MELYIGTDLDGKRIDGVRYAAASPGTTHDYMSSCSINRWACSVTCGRWLHGHSRMYVAGVYCHNCTAAAAHLLDVEFDCLYLN